jgi:lysyl-tRNA synthetase class II
MALSEQEILRREALTQLRELGIDPYPANEFVTTAYSSEILADFDKYDGKKILAGRLMGKRIMGKASFAELKDAEGGFKSMLREMIFRLTKRKQCTMLFQKNYWILAILLGFVERFQNAGG